MRDLLELIIQLTHKETNTFQTSVRVIVGCKLSDQNFKFLNVRNDVVESIKALLHVQKV